MITDGREIAMVEKVKVRAKLGEMLISSFIRGAIEKISECIGIPISATIVVDIKLLELTKLVMLSIEKNTIINEESVTPKITHRAHFLNTPIVSKNAFLSLPQNVSQPSFSWWSCPW